VGEIRGWFVARVPESRDLSREQMVQLAAELGSRRDLWQHLVRHDPNTRVFEELYRDAHLDVWLICWLNQQETGFHDHDLSSGAVWVCDGELAEDKLLLEDGLIRHVSIPRGEGTGFDFDAAHIHCMRHPGGGPAVSLHLYSPALWRMGHYSVDDEGNFRRASITYADEMWSNADGIAALRP
jgi:hypothetical protein